MSDVVLVSLFSVAGTVLVATAGAVATIFGPAWRERALRREDRRTASDDLRYERALEFIEALAKLGIATYWHDTLDFHKARNSFVATLRPGEGDVESYTSRLYEAVHAEPAGPKQMEIVNDASNQIFGWLRGDIKASSLRVAGDAP